MARQGFIIRSLLLAGLIAVAAAAGKKAAKVEKTAKRVAKSAGKFLASIT